MTAEEMGAPQSLQSGGTWEPGRGQIPVSLFSPPTASTKVRSPLLDSSQSWVVS